MNGHSRDYKAMAVTAYTIIGMLTAESIVVSRKMPEDSEVFPPASSVYIVTSDPVGVDASTAKDSRASLPSSIKARATQIRAGTINILRKVIQITRRLNIWLKSL